DCHPCTRSNTSPMNPVARQWQTSGYAAPSLFVQTFPAPSTIRPGTIGVPKSGAVTACPKSLLRNVLLVRTKSEDAEEMEQPRDVASDIAEDGARPETAVVPAAVPQKPVRMMWLSLIVWRSAAGGDYTPSCGEAALWTAFLRTVGRP